MNCPKCQGRLIAAPEYGTGGVRCLCGWLKLGVLPTVMKEIPTVSKVEKESTPHTRKYWRDAYYIRKAKQEVNHA